MEKNLKCLLLKNDIILVSEIEEQMVDMGEPDCKLINPYQYMNTGELILWPSVTDQREVLIHSDSIFTIVDPKEEIIQKYTEITS